MLSVHLVAKSGLPLAQTIHLCSYAHQHGSVDVPNSATFLSSCEQHDCRYRGFMRTAVCLKAPPLQMVMLHVKTRNRGDWVTSCSCPDEHRSNNACTGLLCLAQSTFLSSSVQSQDSEGRNQLLQLTEKRVVSLSCLNSRNLWEQLKVTWPNWLCWYFWV